MFKKIPITIPVWNPIKNQLSEALQKKKKSVDKKNIV